MKNILYDASKIDRKNLMFDNKMLRALLIPIIIEQVLNSFMGMMDTVMVSNVGSSAMSSVALVDSVNTLVIQVFAAMATGASIICSQYLGSGDVKGCNRAAKQVLLTVFTISVVIMVLCLIFRRGLLHTVFGKVESEDMEQCLVYFFVTVLSYPFLALFSAGAAFFRAGGAAKFPMLVSFGANIVNIIGNAVFIFGMNMGVFGAALSTLISRIICMTVVYARLRKDKQPVVLREYFKIRPDMALIKKIVAIGLPAGIENGMFQFGKLAIQSMISSMGTVAIAAQSMAAIFENVNGVVGIGVGIGLMTAVGQCIGAGRKEEAKYYIVKFTWIGEIGILLSCILVFIAGRPVTIIGGMEPDAAALSLKMLTAITVVKPVFWSLSYIPAYGMRAAGDVKFSMIAATCTMWLCRVVLCVILINCFNIGAMAFWYCMFADWAVRGIVFTARYFSGKWMKNSLVG